MIKSWKEIEEIYIKNGWEYISVCHNYIEIAKWGNENKDYYDVLRFNINYE